MFDWLIYAGVVLLAAVIAVPGGLLMRWWFQRVVFDAFERRQHSPDLPDHDGDRRRMQRRLR